MPTPTLPPRAAEARVVSYLHAETRKDLVGRCESVLLRAHAPRMWETFQALLDFDGDEDLPRMYALLALREKKAAMVARSFKAACRVFGNHWSACTVLKAPTPARRLDLPMVHAVALTHTSSRVAPSAAYRTLRVQ
ncbi:hypothetical protein DFH09DRAFT_1365754 [Mycena vulgaris]|nr:hypothetical protein DFH09DRAFT_1365754 [Mycena vulgaris]